MHRRVPSLVRAVAHPQPTRVNAHRSDGRRSFITVVAQGKGSAFAGADVSAPLGDVAGTSSACLVVPNALARAASFAARKAADEPRLQALSKVSQKLGSDGDGGGGGGPRGSRCELVGAHAAAFSAITKMAQGQATCS